MHPVLFHAGPITVYTFGVCFAVAVLLGGALAVRQARRQPGLPLSPDGVADLLLSTIVGGLIGARLLYVLLEWRDYVARPWEIVALWHGGLVYYGGFAGGVAATWWWLRRRLRPQGRWSARACLRIIDLLIPSLAIAQSIGRLGCFFNGCCYGRPTMSAWGMRVPGAPVPLYPTQLMEAFGTLLLFVWLRMMQRRLTPQAERLEPGLLTGAYLVLYGVLRFGIEGLRGDNPRWWPGLTLSQWLGLVAVPAGAWLLWRRKKGPGPEKRDQVPFSS